VGASLLCLIDADIAENLQPASPRAVWNVRQSLA
jgi:hypothetical protein